MAQTVFNISSYFINSATARASHSLTSLTTARCREPEVSETRYCSLRHGRPCVLAPHRSTLPALRRQPSLLKCPCDCTTPLPSPAPSALAGVCPNPHPHLGPYPGSFLTASFHVSFPIPKSIGVKMIKEPQMSYSENHLLF